MRPTRYMYCIYLIVGGIYTSKNISNRIKYTWVCSCALIMIVDFIGGLIYLQSAEVVKPVDIISILYTADGKLYFFIVVPLVTYRYHRQLESLFEYFENAGIAPSSPWRRHHQRCDYRHTIRAHPTAATVDDVLIKRVDSVAAAYFWFALILTLGVCFIMAVVIDINFFCDEEEPYRDLQHHVTLLPFINSVPSLRVFWMVYLVESVFVMFAMIAGFPEAVLVSMIACEFNNVVVDFCARMRMLTDFVNAEYEAPNHRTDYARTLSVFQRNTVALVREHQKLIKMVESIRPYIEIFDTIMLIALFGGIYCSISLVLLTDLEYALKFKQVLVALIGSVFLFTHCELGNTCDAMNEAIVAEVYNLPWYHLNPKCRKLVHVFLCQVQKPIRFKAFNVYAVNLALFPKILKAAYTYTNMLRGTMNYSARYH